MISNITRLSATAVFVGTGISIFLPIVSALTIDWSAKDSPDEKVLLPQCEDLTFNLNGQQDIMKFKKKARYKECAFDDAVTYLGRENGGSFTITGDVFRKRKKDYYGSQVDNNCNGRNLKVLVDVIPKYNANVGFTCDALSSDAIAKIKVPNIAGCERACNSKDECMAFEFDPRDNKNCKLFEFVPEVGQRVAPVVPTPRPAPAPRPNPTPPVPAPAPRPNPTPPPPAPAPAPAPCVGQYESCASAANCCGNLGCYNFDNFLIKLGRKCSDSAPQYRRLLIESARGLLSSSDGNNSNIGMVKLESPKDISRLGEPEAHTREEVVLEAEPQSRRTQANQVACYTAQTSCPQRSAPHCSINADVTCTVAGNPSVDCKQANTLLPTNLAPNDRRCFVRLIYRHTVDIITTTSSKTIYALRSQKGDEPFSADFPRQLDWLANNDIVENIGGAGSNPFFFEEEVAVDFCKKATYKTLAEIVVVTSGNTICTGRDQYKLQVGGVEAYSN